MFKTDEAIYIVHVLFYVKFFLFKRLKKGYEIHKMDIK